MWRHRGRSQQLSNAPRVFHGGIVFEHAIVLVHLIPITMHDDCLLGRLQNGQRLFQKRRLPQIVLVEKGEVWALGEMGPGVAGRGLAAVLAPTDVTYARHGLYQRTRVVGRGIVHYDELAVGAGLREHGKNGLFQIAGGAVVGGNDDADSYHGE